MTKILEGKIKKENQEIYKKSLLNFDIMFDSRFDISKNNSKIFGKQNYFKSNKILPKIVFSENLLNNKIQPYKQHSSEVFCVKLNSMCNSLFSGGFNGLLLQQNNCSQKIQKKYNLDFVIWSICFINSSLMLVGGNENFSLINIRLKVKIQNLFIDQLGPKMSKVVYKMDFIRSSGSVGYPRLVCKTNFNYPFLVKLQKLKDIIIKNKKQKYEIKQLKKRNKMDNSFFTN